MSMLRSLKMTAEDFVSSCGRTPQYLKWHRLFKREFTHELESRGCTDIQIGEPNHFDMSGFFTYRGRILYFSIGDLRWDKGRMLIRTARSYTDYTGGQNYFVSLKDENEFGFSLWRLLEGLCRVSSDERSTYEMGYYHRKPTVSD